MRLNEARREFVLNTWSREVMSECSVVEKQTVYTLEKTGIWGEAVRQRRAIILNDFTSPHPLKKGLPEGHAPLTRYMTIPVFSGEAIVAVLGVADKSAPYSEADVRQVKLLMEPVWRIVERNVDFTKRKKTEEALRFERELMSNLLERAPVSIFVTSREGRMRLVNRQWEKVTGKSRRQALDAPLNIEECIGSPEAPRHFHTVRFPLYDGEGRVDAVGGLSLDVTEMRQAAAERSKLELHVQRAQKPESLGVLAGGIAHDFNNLLMAILGNADMALQEMLPDSPARRKAGERVRGRGAVRQRELDRVNAR